MKTRHSQEADRQDEASAKNHSSGSAEGKNTPAVPADKLQFTLRSLNFPQRQALRFIGNFLKNYKEDVRDNDIFKPLDRAILSNDVEGVFSSKFSQKELERMRLIISNDDDCDFDGNPFLTRPRSRGRKKVIRMFRTMDSCREIFERAWNVEAMRPRIAELVIEIATRYEKSAAGTPKDFIQSRFEEIKKTLMLSDYEFDTLVLTYVKERGYFDFPETRLEDTFYTYLRFFSKCLDSTENTLLQTLSGGERLRRFGCLLCGSRIVLPGELDSFLDGLNDRPLLSRYYKKSEQETLPWDFFGDIVKEHGEILKQIISNRQSGQGINILLHGLPGTGKTSFAHALAKELNLTAYSVAETLTNKRDLSANPTFRFGALQFTAERVERDKSLIIVDEADDMLTCHGNPLLASSDDEEEDRGGGHTGKGLLNYVLDSTKTVVIWLTNTPCFALDPSNRRRFDYAIEFEAFSDKQRLQIWRNIVAKQNLDALYNDALLEELSAQFAVNAGTISIVLKNIANIKPAEKNIRKTTLKLLTQQCKLLGVDHEGKKKFSPAKDYSLEGLNIKTNTLSLDRIVEAVRKFQKGRANTTGDTPPDSPRMNILLHGAPGSGKTEFVKYLAKTLGTKVVKKMGSDLLDCYLGNSEKNIAAAFREAEREKAILFMDEFDGLLQTREKAWHSWETTQVNEILDKMENFDGVFIAATNFAENLDPAALRRFTFKVEFDFLDNNGKRHFFAHFFGTPLNEAEAARLDCIENLTPGDFRTARQSLYYLGSDVTNDERLDVLEKESEEKTRAGFVRKNRRAGF